MKYIRPLVLLFLFSLVSETASAQLTWGFKGGLNLNTIHVNSDEYFLDDFGWQPGYHAGLFFQHELSDRTDAGADLLLSQRGFRYQEVPHILNYLTVPVYVQYRLLPEFHVQAGVSASLLLGYRIDRVKSTDMANDGSISLLGGATYVFNVNWQVSARYYHALAPYQEVEYIDAGGTDTDRIRYFNRTVELSIAFTVL